MMFENFIKLDLSSKYAIGNKLDPYSRYIILEGGGQIIYDELSSVNEKEFNFNDFCILFSKKYNVNIEFVKEDVDLVIHALEKLKLITVNNETTQDYFENFSYGDTLQEVLNYYNDRNKIYKVFIELTYDCNLRCPHCYLGTDINSTKMAFNFLSAKTLLDDLHELGVVELAFTGGECFLNPDTLEIIEYACSLGFLVGILTNGTLLDEKIISKLVDLPISYVRISIYGSKDYHDRFVGKTGSFDQSFAALKLLNQHRNGFGIATSVMTKPNINGLLEEREIFQEFNITHKMTPVIFPTAKGDLKPTKLRLSSDQLGELLNNKIIDYRGSKCSAGISRLRITPNGDVNPCELFRNVNFGNIFKNNISEIINSSARMNWVKNIRIEIEKSACEQCDKRKHCPVCIGLAYLESGSLHDKPERVCYMGEVRVANL